MKKNVMYIVCSVVVLVLLVCMLAFALPGCFGKETNPDPVGVSVSGTWSVLAMVEKDTVTVLDGEFMVFDAEKAALYKGGNTETAAVTSAYQLSTDNQLKLTDISRSYKVDQKSANILRLYETTEKYLLLARKADMSAVTVTETTLVGKWKVNYKTGNAQIDEVLEFTADTLNDYRDGATTPTATSGYMWQEGNYIYAAKFLKQFKYHPVSDTVVVFLEPDSGVEWELELVK